MLFAVTLAACGGGPSEAEVEATVKARIEQKQAEDAALAAKAQAMAKAMVEATAQAVPTAPSVPPSPTPTATPIPPTPTPTATHTPAPDPYIALSDVRQAMGNIDSYHADYVMVLLVDGPGLQLEMRFDITHDYESPDKARVHLIAEILGERMDKEAIRIGNTVYTKEFPSTEWTSEIPDDDDDFEVFRPVWEDSYLLDRDRVQFVGFEDLDGVSVYHFETDDPSAAAQMLNVNWEFPDELVEGSTRTDLWINTESHLIERIAFENDEIDASILDFPSTVTLKFSFELTLSAFNKEVVPSIVAPAIVLPEPAVMAPPSTADNVLFPDAGLDAAIREALGKAVQDKITSKELAKLVELRARGILDLTGLEYATNLTTLNLSNNQISDVSPLASLTNLTELSLEENPISDVSPLASLTNLTTLNLGNNQISDVSPLASLTNLTTLYLWNNEISDVSPLASLTNLTDLHLSGNQGNQISDVSPLHQLTNLTTLDLSSNEISDVSPLASLTNLTMLNLGNNWISDVSPLASLTNLTTLYLWNNEISDVSPLASLTNLTWLSIDENQISDVSPLASLTNLTMLSIDENQISDVSPLALLTNLFMLNLRGNPLDLNDIQALRNIGVIVKIDD